MDIIYLDISQRKKTFQSLALIKKIEIRTIWVAFLYFRFIKERDMVSF